MEDNVFQSIHFDTDIKQKDTFTPLALVSPNWDLQELSSSRMVENQHLSICIDITAVGVDLFFAADKKLYTLYILYS